MEKSAEQIVKEIHPKAFAVETRGGFTIYSDRSRERILAYELSELVAWEEAAGVVDPSSIFWE